MENYLFVVISNAATNTQRREKYNRNFHFDIFTCSKINSNQSTLFYTLFDKKIFYIFYNPFSQLGTASVLKPIIIATINTLDGPTVFSFTHFARENYISVRNS